MGKTKRLIWDANESENVNYCASILLHTPSYLIVIAVISPCSSLPGPFEVVGPAASVLTSEVEGKVAMVASVLPLLSMKTGTRILVLGYSGACKT